MMSDQGWGSTTTYGANTTSPVLLEVEQPVVSNAECETAHQTILEKLMNNSTFADGLPDNITINDLLDVFITPITEGMICAGGVAGKGACTVNNMLKSIFDKSSNNKTTGRLWRSSDLQARETAHSHRCDKLGFQWLRRLYIWGIRAF